jgi:DNA-binding CsgD family transcriptional regulator/tetratricopeptide (TPR) repeat protein
MTSSRLVGRVGELAELELAWREAAAGRPGLVLLGGESGVGKTRLLAELRRRLADESALVLRGEGLDQGEAELPYAPLLGALRELVRDTHPAIGELNPGSRRQLATLLPGLDDGQGAAEPRAGTGQLRLFEALLELIGRLSEERPLLLILEDMHWADRSTRAFVSFLVRSLRGERVLVLLSFRSDELHRRHPLRPLLAELERLERTRRIELERFDRSELAEALTDILGDPPGEPLLGRLFARSEGNPLYTEELLAAGLDGRGAAPQSLRDAFMLRIERLAPSAQAAVRAIAAARRLNESAVAELTGLALPEAQAALREALSEQLLIADDDGYLRYRHELLREVVLHDLLPGERMELHLRLARRLEARPPADPLAQAERTAMIAGHYAAAGEQTAALRATVQAARAAGAVHAYGASAELAEDALELWPRVAGAEAAAGIDHVELLLLAAGAHAVGGERARVETLLLSALRELPEDGDPLRRARILDRLARTQWSLNRGLEGVETAQRALDLLPDDDGLPERAMLLAWLARTRVLRGRLRDAVRDGERALHAARAAGDPCAEAEVLNTVGMAQIALGQEAEGIARLHRAMEIAREQDDPDTLAVAYSNLADLLNLRGRTREALTVAREGLAALPRWSGRTADWLTLTVSEMAFELGDWRLTRAHLGSDPSRLVGTLLMFRLTREAELALGEGDAELAESRLAELEPLAAESSEPQWIGIVGSLVAEHRRRAGDLEGARGAVEQALDRLELCTDDVMRIARLAGTGLRIEAEIAQRARDLRERAQERDAITRARLHMQRLDAAAQEGGPVEAAWRVTGRAELRATRGKASAAEWLRAAAAWEAIERPYPAARARLHAAEAAVTAGDRAVAETAVSGVLTVAGRLGSRWLVDEASNLAGRARLHLDGAPSPERAVEEPFGLTPRERQVLALIAEGATNRQIGAALYMAEKTASVHVSRILAKLGVSSRTQAAALAHRQRLT